MERTFSIIKPDATKRNITGKINQMIEQSGLRIIAQKRVKLSIDQAKSFYSIHKEKSFFNDLIEYMTSEAVIVQVLQGDNAVEKYRQIINNLDNPYGDNSAPKKVREAIESVDISDRKWFVKHKLC